MRLVVYVPIARFTNRYTTGEWRMLISLPSGKDGTGILKLGYRLDEIPSHLDEIMSC